MYILYIYIHIPCIESRWHNLQKVVYLDPHLKGCAIYFETTVVSIRKFFIFEQTHVFVPNG